MTEESTILKNMTFNTSVRSENVMTMFFQKSCRLRRLSYPVVLFKIFSTSVVLLGIETFVYVLQCLCIDICLRTRRTNYAIHPKCITKHTRLFIYFFGSISQQSLRAASWAVRAHKKYQKRRFDISYDADREILLPS